MERTAPKEPSARFDAVEIPVGEAGKVSAVVGVPQWWPTGRRVGVVISHDVGDSMDGELVKVLHQRLAERGYLCLRFNFPYVEAGKKRPDPLPMLERSYRAALKQLLRGAEETPAHLVLIGIGLGGRVASQVVAQGVKADGLVLLSFPLHPSGKPGQQKPGAVYRIICPMLFVQGTRDPTCRIERLQELLRKIGAPTKLHVIQDANHAMELVRASQRTPEEIQAEILERVDSFIHSVIE
ncbi:MAG: dienelactone hydrolase family protein [Myxococcales bacterium]|nr:dienelactone hydrolase family protein [Myxococcales bacterium]